MTAKRKEPYRFKLGEVADVVDIRDGRILNTLRIISAKSLVVVGEGPSCDGGTSRWAYGRRGAKWLQLNRKDYELRPRQETKKPTR